MKRNIRFLIALGLIICMSVTISACGSSGQEDAKKGTAGQVQAGPTVEKQGNGKAEVDLAKNLKWPEDSMGNLPEPKATITAVLKDSTTGECTVAFSEMSKEDAETYVSELKKMGFSGEMEMADTESIIQSGKLENGSTAVFVYKLTAKEGSISYGSKSGSASGPAAGGPVDMSDAATWPDKFMNSVPELEGKIVDVVNQNNKYVTVTLEYVDKKVFEDYVARLKQNGFTVDVDEKTSVSSIDFWANNSAGDRVHAYLTIEGSNNTATVEMEKAS